MGAAIANTPTTARMPFMFSPFASRNAPVGLAMLAKGSGVVKQGAETRKHGGRACRAC